MLDLESEDKWAQRVKTSAWEGSHLLGFADVT